LGLWSYRDRCVAATASAHGSIPFCCRRNAILRGKISGGADGRPNCSILLLAFVAAHYGRQLLTTVMSQLGQPVLIVVVGLIAAAITALIFVLARKHHKRAHS